MAVIEIKSLGNPSQRLLMRMALARSQRGGACRARQAGETGAGENAYPNIGYDCGGPSCPRGGTQLRARECSLALKKTRACGLLGCMESTDPAADIRDSVGEPGRHVLNVARALELADNRPGKRPRVMREYILSDNYGNEYLCYLAALKDGEIYEVSDWIRPSVILKYGGWTNALIDAYRAKARDAFDRAERALGGTA